MGAWSYEVLENDCALDMMCELIESEDLKTKLYNIMHETSYVDEMLLAVAVVDASLNGVDKNIFGSLYDYEEWFNDLPNNPLEELKADAIHVIKFVQENDNGWVPDCIIDRQQLLIRIQNRLEGKAVVTDNDIYEAKKKLAETVLQKLKREDRKDIVIENIKVYLEDETKFAHADIKYTWQLKGWVESIEHKNMSFVVVDNEWQSPIFN